MRTVQVEGRIEHVRVKVGALAPRYCLNEALGARVEREYCCHVGRRHQVRDEPPLCVRRVANKEVEKRGSDSHQRRAPLGQEIKPQFLDLIEEPMSTLLLGVEDQCRLGAVVDNDALQPFEKILTQERNVVRAKLASDSRCPRFPFGQSLRFGPLRGFDHSAQFRPRDIREDEAVSFLGQLTAMFERLDDATQLIHLKVKAP